MPSAAKNRQRQLGILRLSESRSKIYFDHAEREQNRRRQLGILRLNESNDKLA